MHHLFDASVQNADGRDDKIIYILVCNFLYDFHFMGDQDDCDAKLPIDPLQKFQDGLRRIGVECTGRFIAQQDIRMVRKGPCDADTLLLAAAQIYRLRFDQIELLKDHADFLPLKQIDQQACGLRDLAQLLKLHRAQSLHFSG